MRRTAGALALGAGLLALGGCEDRRAPRLEPEKPAAEQRTGDVRDRVRDDAERAIREGTERTERALGEGAEKAKDEAGRLAPEGDRK